MKTVLSFKTETNGLPNWKARSDDESQPHLVRLSAVLCNAETQEVIDQMDVVIIPDGWDIPQDTINVHGITFEDAKERGISEAGAVKLFLKLVMNADVIVSSNKQFNNRIMCIAFKRHLTEEAFECWSEIPSYCAMKMAKDKTGNKQLSLSDALSHFTGKKAVDNHDSLVNAKSAAKVFFAINKQN